MLPSLAHFSKHEGEYHHTQIVKPQTVFKHLLCYKKCYKLLDEGIREVLIRLTEKTGVFWGFFQSSNRIIAR